MAVGATESLLKELEGLAQQGMEPDPTALAAANLTLGTGGYLYTIDTNEPVLAQPSQGGGFTQPIPIAVSGAAGGTTTVQNTQGTQAIGPAAVTAAVPLLQELLAALGIGGSAAGALATVGGVAAAGYGAAQALGLGEGGGLFGNNLLGGDDFELGGVQFGGPGLSEPLVPYKEWKVGNTQMYAIPQYTSTGKYRGMKVFAYNTVKKTWKYWFMRKPSLAIIGKNLPSHRNLVRLRHNLMRHKHDAVTILKLTSPNSLRTPRRSYRRRR